MKLIFCKYCHDLFVLHRKKMRKCLCGKFGGKYLKDGMTAVVKQGAILCGIDNGSFTYARKNTQHFMKREGWKGKRLDFFFTGWMVTVPGQVIFVKNITAVKRYKYGKVLNVASTSPINKEKLG